MTADTRHMVDTQLWSAARAVRHRSHRAATRRGGASALNLWLVDFSVELLGFATLPAYYAVANNRRSDGVIVQWNTLPDVADPPYNLEHTATHEVGHWYGRLGSLRCIIIYAY